MKNKTLRLILVLLLLLPALLLVSCSKANESFGGGFDVDLEMPKNESPEFGMTNDKLNATTPPAESVTERKIIKTYDINAETKEFDATIASLETLVNEHGGYVESNSISNRNYNSKMARYASYKFRIPADKVEAFVGSIGNTLNVTRQNSNAQDISESYYSIEATLEELQIERDSLLTMMASLDNQKDYNFWLTIQTRLSEVRQQIARLQAQLNSYDSRVEYSTVSLTVNEVVNYTPDEEEPFGKRLANAFSTGLTEFAEFSVDFAVWFAEALPFLVLFGILLFVICIISRRARAKRKAKKLAKKGEPV
ncbi:MAG: DUF4349 domain-containing protein [Clostridia bacterium]|nr:DUF4349 domain-containing protein [Clostridia bacterium]